jgi:hypothetical protein
VGATVNAKAEEVPPPGAGFTTLIFSVPGLLRREAGITAVRVVEFTKIVEIGVEPI